MQIVRDGGKALSADRVAVMAAINIAHELVKVNEQSNLDDNLLSKIEGMQKSIDSVFDTTL